MSHPTIVWETDSASVNEESTWAMSLWHTCHSGTEFKVTVGNKPYALSNDLIFGNSDETSGSSASGSSVGSSKKKYRTGSEAALLRKHR